MPPRSRSGLLIGATSAAHEERPSSSNVQLGPRPYDLVDEVEKVASAARVHELVGMENVGPTLETPRLILRPPRAEDFEPFAAFMADPATAKFLGGPLEYNWAWRAWATIAGAWVLNGFSMFSIVEKASGRWVGRAGPWMPVNWPGTEVGWGIVASAQRKGYATEAATAAIDWAFDVLGWTEVIHCIEPSNAASIGVAARLGSGVVRRGVSSGPPFHVSWDLYGQTREAWRARRAG